MSCQDRLKTYGSQVKAALQDTAQLKNAPKELWICYVNKLFTSFSYFAWSLIMVLYLSAEFGLSDQSSGIVYGAFGACISGYGFFMGFVIDRVGIRTSLITGASIALVGKAILLFARSSWLAYIAIFVIIPIGESLCIPVLTMSIKRYNLPATRPAAFGIFYSVMNVGAVIAGWTTDGFNNVFKEPVEILGASYSAYRMLLFLISIANIIPIITALMCVADIDVSEGGQPHTYAPSTESPLKIAKETLTSKSFWKLILLALIMTNVRAIFRHLDATLPKYMQRTFGDTVAFGSIYSINPIIIIFLTPFVQILTARYSALTCLIVGSWICAVSPFLIWMDNKIWAIVVTVILVSIGESVWSPRMYDYVMKIAPKGKEGTFMSIAAIPLFLAQLPVGFLSGWLLTTYCPSSDSCNGSTLWAIIGLTTVISPILMVILYQVIHDPAVDISEENEPAPRDDELDFEKTTLVDLEKDD